MPPSGFDQQQAKKISSFLKSCLMELIRESKEFELTFIEGLKKEIANIDEINSNDNNNNHNYHLLLIIRSFYSDLLKQNPQNESEMLKYGRNIYEKVKSDILNIHVPSIRK